MLISTSNTNCWAIWLVGIEWSLDSDASNAAVLVASEAHAITLAIEGLLGVVFTVATLTDEAVDMGEVIGWVAVLLFGFLLYIWKSICHMTCTSYFFLEWPAWLSKMWVWSTSEIDRKNCTSLCIDGWLNVVDHSWCFIVHLSKVCIFFISMNEPLKNAVCTHFHLWCTLKVSGGGYYFGNTKRLSSIYSGNIWSNFDLHGNIWSNLDLHLLYLFLQYWPLVELCVTFEINKIWGYVHGKLLSLLQFVMMTRTSCCSGLWNASCCRAFEFFPCIPLQIHNWPTCWSREEEVNSNANFSCFGHDFNELYWTWSAIVMTDGALDLLEIILSYLIYAFLSSVCCQGARWLLHLLYVLFFEEPYVHPS